jgi:hypothetical protein
MDQDDTLWYIDAGAIVMRNGLPSLPESFYLQSSFFHDVIMWCSSAMNKLPHADEFFRAAIMVDASVIGFKCNTDTIQFVKEWDSLCADHSLLSGYGVDSPSPPFIDHRHDQSLLSYLGYIHSLKLSMPLTQFSGSSHPSIFHHRAANSTKNRVKLKNFLQLLSYKLLFCLRSFLSKFPSPIPPLGSSVFVSILAAFSDSEDEQ